MTDGALALAKDDLDGCRREHEHELGDLAAKAAWINCGGGARAVLTEVFSRDGATRAGTMEDMQRTWAGRLRAGVTLQRSFGEMVAF